MDKDELIVALSRTFTLQRCLKDGVTTFRVAHPETFLRLYLFAKDDDIDVEILSNGVILQCGDTKVRFQARRMSDRHRAVLRLLPVLRCSANPSRFD